MDIDAGLRAIARGERGAFSDVYRHLQPPMLRYALGLVAGDRAAAEDVVNDAFVAIWQQAGTYSGLGSAMGWVRRIVRNKTIDWVRKQREVSLSSDENDSLINQVPDPTSSPQDIAQSQDEAQHLRAALTYLSVEHREVIWLCYFEDRSLSEIADIARCPLNTVKTRLFHARKILRNYIHS
jgi:RNA polymerase sigma-70 factor, ECF subfamily